MTSSRRLSTDIPRKTFNRTWARLIRKIYEGDPLLCPKCQGTMRVIQFIEETGLIRIILAHLGLWDTRTHDPPSSKPTDESPSSSDLRRVLFSNTRHRLLELADSIFRHPLPIPSCHFQENYRFYASPTGRFPFSPGAVPGKSPQRFNTGYIW